MNSMGAYITGKKKYKSHSKPKFIFFPNIH